MRLSVSLCSAEEIRNILNHDLETQRNSMVMSSFQGCLIPGLQVEDGYGEDMSLKALRLFTPLSDLNQEFCTLESKRSS